MSANVMYRMEQKRRTLPSYLKHVHVPINSKWTSLYKQPPGAQIQLGVTSVIAHDDVNLND